MSQTQQGYLLVADITGYTMFLSKSELVHAEEILAKLLELLVRHTRPPLRISRLAGDAVISYAVHGNSLRGQTFVELIEDTYLAFRQAIDLMVLNNRRHCNACANVTALDLKFFVHYGTFAIQRLSVHDELVGNDVNLLHRLLKNRVTEQTGIRAYTLYTDAAVEQLRTYVLVNLLLKPSETGTQLIQQFSKGIGPWWGRILCDLALSTMAKGAQRDIDALKARIESDLAAPANTVEVRPGQE